LTGRLKSHRVAVECPTASATAPRNSEDANTACMLMPAVLGIALF
jgi:hypothetical protein